MDDMAKEGGCSGEGVSQTPQMVEEAVINLCADLCQQSYDDTAEGFTTIGDLRYGVFDTIHGRIICIRGSENAHNWLRNARAIPWRTCGGYLAHKGFVTAYQALCNGGMPTGKDSTLIATGHSLGGAIATLLAEHTGGKCITFGSPRVYARFIPAPKLDHRRFVCDDDPVPHLPAFLFSHKCDPIVLRDGDCSVVEVSDHYISHYIAALASL